MLIQQKYIQKIDIHVSIQNSGKKIVPGVRHIERFPEIISRIGFTQNIGNGETILPSATFGRYSRFNALGKNIIHRDLPMETAYRMVEWHWLEWRGRDETEEMSDYRDVPYKRYPRTFISPPSIELAISTIPNGERLIVAPMIHYVPENYSKLTHSINLFLELFGECEIFTENLEGIFTAPIHRLNWRVLPPGRYPWEKMRELLQPVIRQAKEGNRPVVENRLENVNKYNPEFVAVGQGGFRGYVVFAFPVRYTFVLESPQTNNATYIFSDKWEILSMMSKAEVLDANLQKDRIIHRKGWHDKIKSLLE